MLGVLTILLSFKKCSFNSIAHYSLSNKPHSHQRLKRIRLLIWRSLFIRPFIFHRILFLDEKFNHARKSRGPRTTYCTSLSLTFPLPIDLQPSFWASINNRESPSLDNSNIFFANITERYSRNTNI